MKFLVYAGSVIGIAMMCLATRSALAQQCIRTEWKKCLAPDGADYDRFGTSVAADGRFVVVGAPDSDAQGRNTGAVYIYYRDGQAWRTKARIVPRDAVTDDHFGSSVAMDGHHAVVGSVFDDDNGLDSGSAYVYNLKTGNLITKLLPENGASGDAFGCAVALRGNLALVGAYGNDDTARNAGTAYLFDATTGQQLAQLTPDDAAAEAGFGWSVALNDSLALVGVRSDPANGNVGAAYLFDIATGGQLTKVIPDDGAYGDNFGRSLAISGNLAVIGADGYDQGIFDEDYGSAYIYDLDAGEFLYKLLADDGNEGDHFGSAVAIRNNAVVIGARYSSDGGPVSGSAYVYEAATGLYVAKLSATDSSGYDQAGSAVAAGSEFAIIGAPLDDERGSESGSAYFFKLTGPSLRMPVSACPEGTPFRVEWVCSSRLGRVALLFSPAPGSLTIPNGNPCAGTQLGLASHQLRVISSLLWSDDTGYGYLTGSLPASACGGYLQLVDLSTCTTSNVVRIQ